MNLPPCCINRTFTRLCRVFFAITIGSVVIMAAGCGGGAPSGSSGGPVQGENTLTTVVVSSAANDRLSRFSMTLNSLSLTTKAGTSVPVMSTPQQVEFMHLNGGGEPLITSDVPQGVYTSATATVGSASFTCLVQQSGSDTTSTYAYGATPSNQVTVQLPEPLTLSGNTMALSLNLLVSQSESFPSTCYTDGIAQFSITPTFTLTAMTLATEPTNATNGKMTALEGLVVNPTAGENGFTVSAADGTQPGSSVNTIWQVNTNGNTVFQGIGNAQGMAAGIPVDFDGTLQADGSILATRVAVPDADTMDVTVNQGPLTQVAAVWPVLNEANQSAEGSETYIRGWPTYNFSNATFAVWGGLTNIPNLPFAASFSGSNMVPGQMVSITSHVTEVAPAPTYVPATVETLMPQTINGTVMATGTSGSFTTYTIELAEYDVFPQFAVQSGQTTLLTNPQEVVVYVDANAQVLSQPMPGNPARFTGVIFNDNGTLRMDCTEVASGVAE